MLNVFLYSLPELVSFLLVPDLVVMTGECFQVTINHFYHSEVCVFCQVGQVQTIQLRKEGFTIIKSSSSRLEIYIKRKEH